MVVYRHEVGRESKREKEKKMMMRSFMKGIGQIGIRKGSKSFIGKLRSLLYSISRELNTSTRKMGDGNSLRCEFWHLFFLSLFFHILSDRSRHCLDSNDVNEVTTRIRIISSVTYRSTHSSATPTRNDCD